MKKIIFLIGIMFTFTTCEEPEAIKINDCYYQVGDHVERWSEWYDPIWKEDKITKAELENSDPTTFKVIEHPFSSTCYGKDKNQVYINRLVITGARPESFEFIDEFYAKDDEHIFNYNKMIPQADRDSFEVFDFNKGTFKEYKHEFVRTVVDAKDKNNLYNNGRKANKFTAEVDIESFTFLSAFYFKDKDHIYRAINGGAPVNDNLEHIEEADYDSFQIIDKYGFYAKDKNQVYMNVEGENFETFVPDDMRSFEVLSYYFCKDSKNVYLSGKVFTDVDLATVEATGDYNIKDKNHEYNSWGNVVE